MGLIGDWRAARERRRLADGFLRRLLVAPPEADVSWLARLAGDRRVAERELEFAQRALALMVAGRDALDDRTAADVAHAMAPVVESEGRRDVERGRAWVERRNAYMEAFTVRGLPEPPPVRFARVLLSGAGVPSPSVDAIERAAEIVQVTRARANEALRESFGAASLPDDVRPSAIRPT
ncbi:MAG: hypothetical protein IT353_04160 [Gemmatimonadaceae bacterium]|nr:hypothetical protein [Gemmatimonadaceae bacterium]